MSSHNRIEGMGENNKLTQEQMQQIAQAATTLYNLIPPGAVLRIDVVDKPKVITKGFESRAIVHTLVVMKPTVPLAMQFEKVS